MENSRRTSAQVAEAEKMKEYERRKKEYIAAYRDALHAKLIAEEAALVKYEEELAAYRNDPEGRDPPVKPKRGDFYEVDVPGFPDGAPNPPQGGRRRRHTRRGRKHRSTRRR
jgi:hypothetical protein